MLARKLEFQDKMLDLRIKIQGKLFMQFYVKDPVVVTMIV